jgi:hypothetical protein
MSLTVCRCALGNKRVEKRKRANTMKKGRDEFDKGWGDAV